MEVGKLTVKLRNRTGKGVSRRLRDSGMVPGVCYGPGVKEPLSVTVHPKELKGSLDPVKGPNTVISMTVEDDGKELQEISAMLWEYQTDPVRRTVTHVDFIAIDPEQAIEFEVPLEVTGRAKGVVEGGQITISRHDVPVKCRPRDIPTKFVIDVTPLGIGDVVHTGDLDLPAGVELAVSEELGLVSCIAPEKEAAEEKVAVEGEAAAPAAEAPAGEGQGGE